MPNKRSNYRDRAVEYQQRQQVVNDIWNIECRPVNRCQQTFIMHGRGDETSRTH